MANPLFTLFGQQSNTNLFQQFAQMFRGDPQKKVEELLQSGQMSQEQFRQYSQIADQFTGRRRS